VTIGGEPIDKLWSSADDLFPGFASHWIDTEAGRIFVRSGGSGPALVLLHGFPQTHVSFHRIAPALAKTHTVVCPDLRGYGWSSVPRSDPAHETYSKRAMGRDVVAVMEKLGHVRFALVGHDRGGRVAYRLALDAPGRVERLVLLDILPTLIQWQRKAAGLTKAPHWDFLARPSPEPETEIGKDPLAYFDGLLAGWSKSGTLEAFDPRALTAYRQSCNEPSRIHAFCEDYRAGRTVDAAQDEADLAANRTIACPTFVVWSRSYLMGGDAAADDTAIAIWRRSFAPEASGAAVDSGHFVAEENPAATLAAIEPFLGAPGP
jgi:haloacetate dehalogenase